MARAVFGGGLSPYITKAQDRPTPYNPLGALSTAIRQPFVEDVIVPGISRIRDEMRIAEQEEQIAAQAEAKRAAAAQFLQQAAAAEQQGLDAEVAAAVSGVDVPLMDAAAMEQLSAAGRQPMGAIPGAPGITAVRDAMGLGPADPRSVTTARQLQQARDALLRGDVDAERAVGLIVSRMKRMGMQDVAFDILSGGMGAEDALAAASGQLQQTQQRRGEQEATAAATQRFERALAGELPQVAAEQGAQPIVRDGEVVLPPNWEDLPMDHPQRAAYRQFKKTGELPAPPAQAAQPQAIQRPESIEQANRLRQQATDMEREATGIEGTPVYRTFGDHAMAFLDALDSGDVATQMALMESVGGSTDYQPFGKGAVGKAIGKDASMRARKDLLDLKRKYLAAQRREKTALKLIKAKEKKPRAKKTGGGGVSSSKGEEAVYRVLAALNDGYGLTGKDSEALRRAGLTPLEISRIDPADRESWRVLTGKIRRNKTLKAQANAIMSGRSTPKDIEKAKIRKLEGEAKKLREEAKATDNKVEKKRLEDRADAKEQRAADARIEAAELLAEAATQREERLASAAQRKADREAGAAKRDEVKAIKKEIAELQKDLNAVDVNIAAGGKTDDVERWGKMKTALENKIKALRGKLPATPDKKAQKKTGE